MVPAAGSTQESSDPDTQRQHGHADTHVIHLTQDRRTGLTKDVQRLYSVGRRRSCSTIDIQLPQANLLPVRTAKKGRPFMPSGPYRG